MLAQLAAESSAAFGPLTGQFQRALGGANQAHAVVDAARAQAPLGNFEAAPRAQQHIAGGHPHILEQDFRVAQRRVVITQGRQRAHHAQARRDLGHQNLALLQVAIGVVRVRLAHDDENLRALVHGAGDEPLAAVQHPVIPVLLYAQLDVGGVGGGDLGLGHGVGGADLPCQQRPQPALLLLGVAVAHQHFHVAGIRRIAVEHLRRPQHPAHHFRQRRVVKVAEAVVVGEFCLVGRDKQVPQADRPGLLLQLVHQRHGGETRGRVVQLLGIGAFIGVDVLVHERLQALLIGVRLWAETVHGVLLG